MFNTPDNAWIGKQLANYKITKLLGSGSTGSVYQAFHTIVQQNACIKILFSLPIKPEQGKYCVEQSKQLRELKYDNIAWVYDIGEHDGIYYIATELIEGKTLPQIWENKEVFTARETLNIAIAITEALVYLHENNILHRNIKPANIMLTDNTIKLTDLGLSPFFTVAEQAGTSHEMLGIPFYLAPECFTHEKINERTDMYSLGATLFHMLTGDPPYTGKSPGEIIKQHLQAPLPAICHKRPDVPHELEIIIHKLMAKKQEDRYASMKETLLLFHKCAKSIVQKQAEETERFTTEDKVRLQENLDFEIGNTKRKARVLVVEDSLTICKVICRILEKSDIIKVIGVAHNGKEALDAISRLNPDVITLDYNMPVMDGLTTLKQIINYYSKPVIMLSAFTHDGALTTFECLFHGAVNFIWKTSYSQKEDFKNELECKIRCAANMQLFMPTKPSRSRSEQEENSGKPARSLVIMTAAEGGYYTYLKIIPHIPQSIPCAFVLVQEMPQEVEAIFARYLNQHSQITVKTVEHKEILQEGVCYVINHLTAADIEKGQNREYWITRDQEQEAYINIFSRVLASVIYYFQERTSAVILSGKMDFSLHALKQTKEAGSMIVVQDPKTCFDFATPNVIIKQNLCSKIVADIDIPSILWRHLQKKQECSTNKKIVLHYSTSTKQVISQALQQSTIIIVSGRLSAVNLQDHFPQYRFIAFAALAELKNYLKLYPARVILDSNYLKYKTALYLDALKQDFPDTMIFILHDGPAEKDDPEPLLSIPYRHEEKQLAHLLEPHMNRFCFRVKNFTLQILLLLANKAKWSLKLNCLSDEEPGIIVLRKGKVLQIAYGDLEGKMALQILLQHDFRWQAIELGGEAERKDTDRLTTEQIIPILLVDDDENTYQILCEILGQYYNITHFNNTSDALEVLEQKDFSLILSEMKTATIDGFHLAKTIKQKQWKIPLIFLTASTDKLLVLQGLALGVADYIKKPIKKEIILTRIKNALEPVTK